MQLLDEYLLRYPCHKPGSSGLSCRDPIDATQDATPHHSDEKKIQKNEKQVIEHTIEEGNDDTTENCSTDDKSGDDQSTKSEDDMDSGVTFDEDSEKILTRLRSKKRIGSTT